MKNDWCGFCRAGTAFSFAIAALFLSACEKGRQDMYDQPKYKPLAASDLFDDGNSSRPLPAGSLPHAAGEFAGSSSGRIGEDAVQRDQHAAAAQAMPYPVTLQLLKRGQERYAIYCVPCHSPLGDGDGLVARRGFPHPPSYHSKRLRQAPDRHIFDVITNGYGIMYSYADRVSAPDRWAIVAYIRALQLSQNADAHNLPPELRTKLAASEPGGLP
jgi:mono/diheme cytochrome c family protein